MINKATQNLPLRKALYTRLQYIDFFRKKYLRLLKATFTRNEKRVSYYDLDVLEQIITPYCQFAKQANPVVSPLASRHIWILWQQGWENAPPIVKACAQSWKDMNPDWELHFLDEKSIADFAPIYNTISAPKASRTAKANIARLSLLLENGGVWADATLFCQQPLNNWLPKAMGTGFFTFSYPRPYRYCDIWFLASAPQTHLISAWLAMVRDYWGHFSRPHHYYWMEYLFEFLAQNDEHVAKVWLEMTKLSALGPHLVQGFPFKETIPELALSTLKNGIIPVQKLSHKWRYSGSLKNKPVGLLTGLDYLK